MRTYGYIFIEDLAVEGMLRSWTLSRAISDMSHREFRCQLDYKVQPSLTTVVVADR